MRIARTFFTALFVIFSWKFVEAKPRLLIFAAASMKNVLETVGAEFETRCECSVVFSFAGSGLLARQVEAGAPADIFVSADKRWMQWLYDRSVGSAKNTKTVAGNRLVVVTSDKNTLRDLNELGILLLKGRVSMAEPNSVPAGRYAQQALEAIGQWQSVRKRAVFGENVRVTLRQVARGDVSAAIVYHSDALIENRVGIVFSFSADLHERIEYPAILLRPSELAQQFFDHLGSEKSQNSFKKFGFLPISASRKDVQIGD